MLDEAQQRFEEAVKIWRKLRGDEHPLVATGLNNLAVLLQAQVWADFAFIEGLFFDQSAEIENIGENG